MGCDIHLYVERRSNRSWESVEEWELEDGDLNVPYVKRFYTSRNYDLFAILANVRNGRGFADTITGEGFNPISEPKGLPEDVSYQVRAVSSRWGEDGHSHSYLTLRELFDYDWTQTVTQYGVLSAGEYYRWSWWGRSHGERPQSWSGGVFGGAVKNVSEQKMDCLIQEAKTKLNDRNPSTEEIEKALPNYYTRAQWDVPYYKCVTEFWGEVIPRLLRYGKPEDVRIVFWFDN